MKAVHRGRQHRRLPPWREAVGSIDGAGGAGAAPRSNCRSRPQGGGGRVIARPERSPAVRGVEGVAVACRETAGRRSKPPGGDRSLPVQCADEGGGAGVHRCGDCDSELTGHAGLNSSWPTKRICTVPKVGNTRYIGLPHLSGLMSGLMPGGRVVPSACRSRSRSGLRTVVPSCRRAVPCRFVRAANHAYRGVPLSFCRP